MMLARRIFCSVKYYNLVLVSAAHLEEEAKINPSTILSDSFIWKLRANANCRGEVTWRYQMITSCFSWVPSQLFRTYQESAEGIQTKAGTRFALCFCKAYGTDFGKTGDWGGVSACAAGMNTVV